MKFLVEPRGKHLYQGDIIGIGSSNRILPVAISCAK